MGGNMKHAFARLVAVVVIPALTSNAMRGCWERETVVSPNTADLPSTNH